MKIIATLGPACDDARSVLALLRAGVDTFRINLSHGHHSWVHKTILTIRRQSKKIGKPVCVLADLQGPKIRTGLTRNNEPIAIQKNTPVILKKGSGICTAEKIFIQYGRLTKDIKRGHAILINDGAIRLVVKSVVPNAGEVHCISSNSGSFSSKKGVNFPDSKLEMPLLTAKDRADLKFLENEDVDAVALSFVRDSKDMVSLKRILGKWKSPVLKIAKIEKPEALSDIQGILAQSDGLMVARGDLGVEIGAAKTTVVQKKLIERANAAGKLVIVATQMLESMMNAPRPTRAEASDVANAVLDGVDAVMLSGETSVGINPKNAVKTMADIATEMEKSEFARQGFKDLNLQPGYGPFAICEAAAWASQDLGGVPAAVFTNSGETAIYLSKIRFHAPIYAFTSDIHVYHKLSLYWNTIPKLISPPDSLAKFQAEAKAALYATKKFKKGARLIMVSGNAWNEEAVNLLQIYTLD